MAAGILNAQPDQQTKNSPAVSGATKLTPQRLRAVAAQVPAPAEQPEPAPEPEQPKWPVNETPVKPAITWDSRGLRIEANNSSLHEILNEVSTDTGAKVEGIGTDERVFGEFGPGAARDVISQLLHGSNYNVLMIGDRGEGTPRQIVLTARRAGVNAPPNANQPGDDQQPDEDFVPEEPQPEEPPVQPQPIMNGRPPGQMIPQGPPGVPQGPPGAPRTPQQVLQELQQRQQQMMDQQQQQQQQQPPPQQQQ